MSQYVNELMVSTNERSELVGKHAKESRYLVNLDPKTLNP